MEAQKNYLGHSYEIKEEHQTKNLVILHSDLWNFNKPGRLYGIFPTTEKLSEEDIEALWNQYMKQYRDSLKIVDGKLVVNGDPRNALLGKVSAEELEQYRMKLEREGIGDEIASCYAVLKDRIEKNYSGDEKEQQFFLISQSIHPP